MKSERAPKCKHPHLDKTLRCKTCGAKVDIRAKRNKYGNRRTDGFASKREAERFKVLELRERLGEISGLLLQKTYRLVVNGHPVGSYRSDFVYFDEQAKELIVEDTKGFRTPVYQLKRKLMKACHGIDVVEV